MKSFLLVFAIASTTLHAREFSPWLLPTFELQARGGYALEHIDKIQSNKGPFRATVNHHLYHVGLDAAIWPYYELDLDLSSASFGHTDFAFESFAITGRYMWLDTLACDPVNAVWSLTIGAPGSRLIRRADFFYPGNVIGSLDLSIGKEWCDYRVFGLAGVSASNRGKPWLNFIASFEKSSSFTTLGISLLGLLGLGNRPFDLPFRGYGPLAFRSLDILGFARLPLGIWGEITFFGDYNLWAKNFPIHSFAIGGEISIPFSL